MDMQRGFLKAVVVAWVLGLLGATAVAQSNLPANKVFRFVPHANLAVLDPIWTTAYVPRTHPYMIYDTLFSEDAKGNIRRKWCKVSLRPKTARRGLSNCAQA